MLILVRHGRTEVNAAGLFQGRLDPALDTVGRVQAAAAAAVLAGADRVVCSPLRRARETAEEIGLPLSVDERWIELDYGEWDGAPVAGVSAQQWKTWHQDLEFAPPGGESLLAVGARVRAACEDLAEEAATRDIVVVSHVSPIKAAVAWALQATDDLAWKLMLSPGSISRLVPRAGGAVLHSFNETVHLTGDGSRVR